MGLWAFSHDPWGNEILEHDSTVLAGKLCLQEDQIPQKLLLKVGKNVEIFERN